MKLFFKEMKQLYMSFSQKQKKMLGLGALFTLLILIIKQILPERFVDDWQYKPENYCGGNFLYFLSEHTHIFFWVMIGIILIWLLWSMYWIIKGKPKAKNNTIIHDPRRKIAYLSLFGPLSSALFLVVYFSGASLWYFSSYIDGLMVGIFIVIYFLFFVVHPIKFIIQNKQWKGLVLIILSVLVSLFGFGTFVFLQDSFGVGFGGTISEEIIPGIGMENHKALNQKLGFSVGGARDVANFREKLEKGIIPEPSDLTYEGIFYDYYFDLNNKEQKQDCKNLFCPKYSTAVSRNPITGEKEYFMTVGLGSNISADDFKRKALNIAVVLDISGSMGDFFDGNYGNESKMEIALKSVNNMIDHLRPDDRLSVVLFDDEAYLAKPFRLIKKTDIAAIKKHILEIEPVGGTNMSDGIQIAKKEFLKHPEFFDASGLQDVENRIIFLTDAMPNVGITSSDGLLSLAKDNLREGIHMTFIGIGIDFDTQLVSEITKVRGANYYSVHSANDFKKRLADEFDFMVTPMVYDLALSVDSEKFTIEKVYGAPESNIQSGEIIKIGTLFPSKTESGKTRGGVVLLKLKKKNNKADGRINVKTSYIDTAGRRHFARASVSIKEKEHFESSGIQKAIVLVRYVDILKKWMLKNVYTEKIEIFKKYFNKTIDDLEDFDLFKEIEFIEKIKNQSVGSLKK